MEHDPLQCKFRFWEKATVNTPYHTTCIDYTDLPSELERYCNCASLYVGKAAEIQAWQKVFVFEHCTRSLESD